MRPILPLMLLMPLPLMAAPLAVTLEVAGLEAGHLPKGLPDAPAGYADGCGAPVAESISAKHVVAAGWVLISEATLGQMDVVTFAHKSFPGPSGTCQYEAGNLAFYDAKTADLLALVWAKSSVEFGIGRVFEAEDGSLRLTSGELEAPQIARITLGAGGVAITPPAATEAYCQGKITLPRLQNLPLGEARAKVIALGWTPLPEAPEALDVQAQDYAKAGWPEARACSGTGLNYCAFGYGLEGHELQLTTMGEGEAPIGPTVVEQGVTCAGAGMVTPPSPPAEGAPNGTAPKLTPSGGLGAKI